MVNRKRLPSDDAANPLPPRKSAHLAPKAVAGGGDSSGPSKTVTPRPDDDDSSGPSKTGQKDSSQGNTLDVTALDEEVAKIAKKKANPELMILDLMRRYSFDLSQLQKLLRRRSNQPQVA